MGWLQQSEGLRVMQMVEDMAKFTAYIHEQLLQLFPLDGRIDQLGKLLIKELSERLFQIREGVYESPCLL